MRDTSLWKENLCCPACKCDLSLDAKETDPDGHIMIGDLACKKCQATYPVIGGIPRFVLDELDEQTENTVAGFGYQWTTVDVEDMSQTINLPEVFLDFISPVTEEHFKGKLVMDAGCGSGRFIVNAQKFGAVGLIGADLSASVEAAFERTRALDNVLIIQANLFDLPLIANFDYAYSIGVLHHTPDPAGAFDAVVRHVKPGGGISAWVYGLENNEWIVKYLNPFREKVTSRLPRYILRTITFLLTLILFPVTKLIYRPIGKFSKLAGLKKFLFYFDYLFFFSRFGFWQQYLIVFDHLVPELASYIPYDEFKAWFERNNLDNVVITDRAKNSWRGYGEKAE